MCHVVRKNQQAHSLFTACWCPTWARRRPTTDVIMATHTAPHRPRFALDIDSLRSALHRRAPAAAPARTVTPHQPWLERLAAWAERQPVHHHLGSNTRL
ncbi:MAG: hypothetical protein C0505_17060 [Leptothrix sp. (in: Bacteria)]|nr:hypothetical protein [Leptothrix sp. (in: b-proteobacteria)]